MPIRLPPEHHPRSEWLALALAQAVWWAAILTGAAIASALLLVQAALHWHAGGRQAFPWRLPLLVAASGLLFDALAVATGLVQFRAPVFFGLPLWLAVLWLSFALTVPSLFRLLPNHTLRVLLFACAGPLAYVGGAALGAADVLHHAPYVLLLVAGWVLLPLGWWRVNARFANAWSGAPNRDGQRTGK